MLTDYPTCADRIEAALAERVADIRKLLDLYYEDPEGYDDDLGSLYDYGLSLEWSEPDETGDRYIRFIMSTGGPHDEFRFWPNGIRISGCERIEYVMQDWWDHASRDLSGDDFNAMADFYDWFIDFVEPEPMD